MLMLRKFWVLMLALLLVLQSAQANDTPAALEVGQPAPSFALRDANGKERRLSDLKDQKSLLLTFFPKCFTGHCASQLTSLREVYKEAYKTNNRAALAARLFVLVFRF